MAMSAIPLWKKKISECLKKSYKVDLSGENIDDLANFGTIKLMVQLDLSYVQSLSSLEGLSPQPALQTLILDGSSISSLKNFSSISTVTSISLKNTPLFLSTPRFNLIASILIVLPKLKIYNGKLLSQKTIDKVTVANYPPKTAEMVNLGWIVEYPCPSEIIFQRLYSQITNKNLKIDDSKEINQPTLSNQNDDDFNDLKHDKRSQSAFSPTYSSIVKTETDTSSKRSPKSFKDVVEERKENESNLAERVADILRKNGIEIDVDNLQQSVLSAIDSLCSERERQVMSVMASYNTPRNENLGQKTNLDDDFDEYQESD